jgi:ATP-dependent DNA helicase DinG
MMSATMISKEQLCKDLSLDMSEVSYINCPFIFNIDNMPIYPLNAGKMNYGTKEKTLPKMVEFIKELMDEHKSERGIIHTVSYDIAEYITNNIKTDRFIIPKGKDRDKKIQEFMKSKRNDLILLSPSLTEGISLNDDLSRFSIICKLPFASLGDKFVKTRMELDNEWYSVNTVKNLIQMTGRSIRSETDYAATYVLDSGFSWFIQKNKKYFPKWWLKAIQN